MMVVNFSVIVVNSMFLTWYHCYLGTCIFFLHTNDNITLAKIVGNVVSTVHHIIIHLKNSSLKIYEICKTYVIKIHYSISINNDGFATPFLDKGKIFDLIKCWRGVGFAPFLRFVFVFTCFPLCLKMITPAFSAYGAE